MPRLLTKVLRANEFWVFLVIFALTLVIQARSGQFYTPNNLVDLAGAMVVPGLFAVAAHLVLVSGGIDVSFPALASLAVYVTTRVLVDNGWNGSIMSSFSPVPMNLMGLPVTALTDSAAPPRASPSSFVSITPSMSSHSLND